MNVPPLYIADIDIHILVFPKGFFSLHCHQPPPLRCKLHFLSWALPSVHTTLTHQRETARLLNYSYLCMHYFIQYLFVLCVCCPSLVWLCNGQLLSWQNCVDFFRSTSPEFRPGPYLLRYPNLYGGGEHYWCKVKGFIFSLCPLRIPSDSSSVTKALYVESTTLHSCWTPSIYLFHPYMRWFKCFESSVSTETSITTLRKVSSGGGEPSCVG